MSDRSYDEDDDIDDKVIVRKPAPALLLNSDGRGGAGESPVAGTAEPKADEGRWPALPSGAVLRAIDLLQQCALTAQTNTMRQASPLFDVLFRLRAACGNAMTLVECVEAIAAADKRKTERVAVAVATRLLSTSSLSVDDVSTCIAFMFQCARAYATTCVLLALTRLTYVDRLLNYFESPAGQTYRLISCRSDLCLGETLGTKRLGFEAALTVHAVEIGAMDTAEGLLRQQWVRAGITLDELAAVSNALRTAVSNLAERAADPIKPVPPLFDSDEQARAMEDALDIQKTFATLFQKLSSWHAKSQGQQQQQQQQQSPDGDAPDAVGGDTAQVCRYQIHQLNKLSEAAGELHTRITYELCEFAKRDDADALVATPLETQVRLAREFTDKLQERGDVCEKLEMLAPSDVDQNKVDQNAVAVLCNLEDALYQYRIWLASKRSGHFATLRAAESTKLTHDPYAAEERLRAALDADT